MAWHGIYSDHEQHINRSIDCQEGIREIELVWNVANLKLFLEFNYCTIKVAV